MNNRYDTKTFFLAALKKEMDGMGHGGQAKTARAAGVSRSLLNDILKGRSVGAEEKRRAIAAALGFDDYEAFLDVGRALLKVPPVRKNPKPARRVNLSDELIELLQENRKLRNEIDFLKTQLGQIQALAQPGHDSKTIIDMDQTGYDIPAAITAHQAAAATFHGTVVAR